MANRNDDRESDHSGEMGRRNRTTPGRTPGELGLDPEEMRGHDAIAQRGDRTGDDIPLTSEDDTAGPRQDPPLTPGVEKDGTGGVSESGGLAGGARGNAGESDTGAGVANGESRSGPGEYKSTSRGTFDRGQA
jgi:hypothetical protein